MCLANSPDSDCAHDCGTVPQHVLPYSDRTARRLASLLVYGALVLSKKLCRSSVRSSWRRVVVLDA